MSRAAQLLDELLGPQGLDFVDINCGEFVGSGHGGGGSAGPVPQHQPLRSSALNAILRAHTVRAVGPPPGCPIDLVCNKGAGSALLLKQRRLEGVVRSVTSAINRPVIVKLR
jgi:hypothetical protein